MARTRDQGSRRGGSGGGGLLAVLLLAGLIAFVVMNPGAVGRFIGSLEKAAISAPAPEATPTPRPQVKPNVDPNKLRAAVRKTDREVFADLGPKGKCGLSSGAVPLPVNIDLGWIGEQIGKPQVELTSTTMELVDACVQVNAGYDWTDQAASDYTLDFDKTDNSLHVRMNRAPAILDRYVSDYGKPKIGDTFIRPKAEDAVAISDAAKDALVGQVVSIGCEFLVDAARQAAVEAIKGRVLVAAHDQYPDVQFGDVSVDIPGGCSN